jgi:hypothetical protein
MSIQSPVHVGEVIRNAVVFDFKNWAGDSTLANSDSLLQAVQRLFALLDERGVDYVLVGGIALLTYVEGRNTRDIDLIMALSSLERLPERNDCALMEAIVQQVQIQELFPADSHWLERTADRPVMVKPCRRG